MLRSLAVAASIGALSSVTTSSALASACLYCAALDRSAASLPFEAAQQPLTADAPLASTANVKVSVGGDLTKEVSKLGERDVREQAGDLADAVQLELDRTGSQWAGSQVNLVITDLKPNRPTLQQAMDRPGLSILHSISIGGASIEGELLTPDGRSLPIRYARYSNHLDEVFGISTWGDADRAFDGLAANLRRGRLVNR